MRIFGIDPGSERTGYGCIESAGSRHRLVICGSLSAPARATFPEKLQVIHAGLNALLERHRPDCVADRGHLLRQERAQRPQAGSRARRGDARSLAGGDCRRRIHPGRDQARGRRLRARREGAGAGDDQAAARARHPARRRTTSPMRWPWRSATCTSAPARSRAPPAPAKPSAPRDRGGTIDPDRPDLRKLPSDDRAPSRHAPREESQQTDR